MFELVWLFGGAALGVAGGFFLGRKHAKDHMAGFFKAHVTAAVNLTADRIIKDIDEHGLDALDEWREPATVWGEKL